ncbi:MAG: hypothetical protein OXN27_09420 [Candidatus Poribacteria bacterium]|nr:hypothetical protein [Candidatus Poribacteria bacterium]
MLDEVTFDELHEDTKQEYFVYFLKLPVGGVIKVGISKIANGNFHKRHKEAQRYFVESIEYLGIASCATSSRAKAGRMEKQVLRDLGRAHPKRELVADDKRVRDYIETHCDYDLSFVLNMSHIAEIRRNRSRS